MPGTSQGNAHPENTSTVRTFASSSASTEAHTTHSALPQPFADGEWEAIVAAAIASVATLEAAEQHAHEHDAADETEATITELLQAQPAGSNAYSLPIAPGASTHILTWRSRTYWLSLCEWIVAHTDRGRAALKRHGIAADTFIRGCAAHAHFAESATGRRVAASIATLVNRSGLSVDQIKRCRRALKALELGVEQARGKKLNGIEREAAARHYEHIHGEAPTRPQIGAASVWALSAPQWAIQAMPEPRRTPRPQRRRDRPTRSPRTITAAPRPSPTTTRSHEGSAPQSLCGSVFLNLSVRKDHLTRGRAGNRIPTTSASTRPLNLQRAAAELVTRIPALRGIAGVDDLTGRRRGHIVSICDLLREAGIDTDRWTGIDIAAALTLDGTTRGWAWPTTDSMRSPLRLVAWRLAQIDWSGPSPTERKTRGRQLPQETPAAAAYRLVRARRTTMAATQAAQAAPASAEHRRAVRAQLTAALAARAVAATA
ncbi:hypothetical protein [Prescottella equi]|uniref:hypothetical protein n=1 Tax=Rhodococcus hoagii TaxID=43767 RepID=UPI000A599B39|nr:hypothetical protein [Prescottella equi]